MAEQVFVTHCLQSDSVRNETGFSVRAASTDDPELLKFAADYPAYELPLDMWANEPGPAQAPRRLALVPAPRGMVALVHSAYVGEDTMGRRGNFFTHLIFYPQLSTVAALQSWGAESWQTSYPRGATKKLPSLDDQSPIKGSTVNDDTLVRFLAGKPVDHSSELATLLFPSRLHGDAPRCRALLAKTLDACLAAWGAAASSRNRVYLLAEPGLVALLLYGVVRLLPEGAAAGLTFTTYENAHRGLRQFKLAFACGTYSSDPDKGLDQEYFRSRGFGLDTFAPDRCSPELAGEPSEAARFLVQHAAQGHWDAINVCNECHGTGSVTADSLGAAHELYRLFTRARPNQAEPIAPRDLLQMQRLPNGAALLGKYHAVLWPTIYRCSMADAVVSRAFAPAIRPHAAELAMQAGRLLGARNAQWQEVWRLVKTTEDAPDKRAQRFVSLLQTAAQDAPTQPYLPHERTTLLREWQEIAAPLAAPSPALPAAVRALLVVANLQEFEELYAAALPAEWLGITVRAAFTTPGPEPWAIEVASNDRNDALLPAVAAALMDSHATPDLLAVLRQLVTDGRSLPLFFRLVKHGLTVPPETLDGLLESCGGAATAAARPFLKAGHVQRLLLSVAQYGKRADPICRRFCDLLAEPRLPGEQQQPLWQQLDLVRKQWTGFPADCAQQLDDWLLLNTLLTAPGQKSATADEVKLACKRRRYANSMEFLREYYLAELQARDVDDPAVSNFVETFCTLAPPGDFYQRHLDRFKLWLKVISGGKDAKKTADLQLFYLERKVVLNQRKQIVNEKELHGKIAPSTLQAIGSMVNIRDDAEPEAVPIASGNTDASPDGAPALRGAFWTAPVVVWRHMSWPQLGYLAAVMVLMLLGTAGASFAIGYLRAPRGQPVTTSPKDPVPEPKINKNPDKPIPVRKSEDPAPVKPLPDGHVAVNLEDLVAHADTLKKLIAANPNADDLLKRLDREAHGTDVKFATLKDVAAQLAAIPLPRPSSAPPPLIATTPEAVKSLCRSLELVEAILESDYLGGFLDKDAIRSLTTVRGDLARGKLDPRAVDKVVERMQPLARKIDAARRARPVKDVQKEAVQDFLHAVHADSLLKRRTHGVLDTKPFNAPNVDLIIELHTAIRAARARERAALLGADCRRAFGWPFPDMILWLELLGQERAVATARKKLDKDWH